VKRLYLLRHAKAKQAEGGGADFDRRLAPRGVRTTPVMAAHMRAKRYWPDFILCSSARRTRETLELLQPGLGHTTEVEFDRRLYLASSADILNLVHGLDDGGESALIVGHNPGLHQLALGLAEESDSLDFRRLKEKFPTLALSVLNFVVEHWRGVAWGRGQLVDFVVPADLDS
jgi:phosphohistidine phosphatase